MVKNLFTGQRKRRRTCCECVDCGRAICPSEFYFVSINLHVYEDGTREVLARYSCCKEP